MAQDLDSKHLRVLEITCVGDKSSDDLLVTAVKYRRDGINGTTYTVANTPQARATTHYVTLDEALPQDISVLKFIFTQQA